MFKTFNNVYNPYTEDQTIQKRYYDIFLPMLTNLTDGIFIWSIEDGRGNENGFTFVGKSARASVVSFWNGGVER